MDTSARQRYSYTAIGFILVYTIGWTLASFLLDPAVPYDALEALNWANNGEFGSPKNPYMVGGVMALGLLLEPVIPIGLFWYLSHFVGVGVGMLGVWLLSRRLFGESQVALISLLSLNLSGMINFDIIPYNDNYLLVTLWPYMFLFFVKAVFDNKYHWLSLAAVSGLAAMSKYSSFAFVPFMFLYTLLVPEARKAYKSPVIYLAVLLFLLLLLPNAIWLYHHDFAAFNWVQSQITLGLNSKAVGAFFAVFYPVILLILILRPLGARWVLPDSAEKKAVLWVFAPPVIIIVAYLLTHCGGRVTEWLQPFAIVAPIVLFSLLDVGGVKSLQVVSKSLLGISILVWAGYSTVQLLDIGGAGRKFSYIGSVSSTLNTMWREKYHQPLRYVGGGKFSHWLTFYAPDRPRMAIPWSDEKKPNMYDARMTDRDISENGAMLVSDLGATCARTNFAEALAAFHDLELKDTQYYSFKDERGRRVMVRLGFLPPRGNPHDSGEQVQPPTPTPRN